MKTLIALIFFSIYTTTINAQPLKKLKDRVNKSIDEKINKAVGIDTPATETEKKENAAASEYSDATENNEKPIFVSAAPANGKMVLKIKKGDRFWGGHISITGKPIKNDLNANVLDSIKARVGTFYTAGELSSYAIYFDGQRFLNDASAIPLRPTFISYDLNKTSFFISTEGEVSTPDPLAAVTAIEAKGNKPLTKEDEAEFAQKMGGATSQPTFSFKYNGKTYGPFNGTGEKLLVLKSMTDGKPTLKFFGFGAESYIGEKEFGFQGLIQTENKVLRVKDYMLKSLAPTYPGGIMAFAQGAKAHTFSNGKTVPVIKIAGIEDMYNAVAHGSKYFSEVYGTDSSHVVGIVAEVDKTNHMSKPPLEAIVDYKTVLKYPVEIQKENLLIATNPAKSVLYKMHTLYYADGTKETIDNVGNAQLVNFNGKDYIVWFEMMKADDGHEIYVCQKELK